MDWGGCVLALSFTVLLLVGLLRGGVEVSVVLTCCGQANDSLEQAPWTSAEVLGPLVASVVSFAAFCLWEQRIATLPLLPLRLFGNRDVVGVMLCTMLTYAATFIGTKAQGQRQAKLTCDMQ